MRRLIIIISIVMLGCQNEEVAPDPSRLGLDFFPVSIGQYQTYQVNDIQYLIGGEKDESNYQLKVEVVDSFYSQTNALTYVIHRSKRDSEANSWELESAWPVRVSQNQVVVTEENVPYIKLSLPAENGKTWDGNALNTNDQDDYEIDSINFAYITPLEDTIPNTLTVIQNDNQDFTVELDRRYEIYARDVGLVYKEDLLFQYCTDEDCIGQQEVEGGHEYRQYIIDYGKN